MIQRIQSVWLLLAAIAVFFSIRLPFYSGTDSVDLVYRTLTGTTNIFILILSSALGTCIVVAIFMFRQRPVQIRLIWISIIAECLIIYLYYRETTFFAEGGFSLWSALHPLILILLIMALRGISRDAKLIRESNRLR